MSMEVTCGKCQGMLIIETPGVVVACPHCGSHLSVSEHEIPTAPEAFGNVPDQQSPADAAAPALADLPTMIANGNFPDNDSVEISIRPPIGRDKPDFSWMNATTPAPPADLSPRFIDPTPAAAAATHHDLDETPDLSGDSLDSFDGIDSVNLHFEPSGDSMEFMPRGPAAAIVNEPAVPPEFKSHVLTNTVARTTNADHNAGTLPDSTAPDRAAGFAKDETSSRQSFLTMLLILVGTYASLVTIYLAYSLLTGRTHQLESLPDLKTVQQQGGKVAIPSPVNQLPPGHQLQLGQTRRFGDIRITPLRVTRGPLQFVHYSGDADRHRSPSEPVLKLWLKLENMSSAKTITPLDTTLMFFNRSTGNGEIASFNVIFPDGDLKKNLPPFFHHFDRIASDSEWLIIGQNANHALAPHQSFETFLPSEENLAGLAEKLVWRVHFRKGLGHKSGNGITTLVDVHFNADEIQPDPV